jgi:hypothetical protein
MIGRVTKSALCIGAIFAISPLRDDASGFSSLQGAAMNQAAQLCLSEPKSCAALASLIAATTQPPEPGRKPVRQ